MSKRSDAKAMIQWNEEARQWATAAGRQLGAWCVDSESRNSLAFVTFVPSALAMGGVMENLCSYNAIRSQWAFSVLND